MNSLGKLVVIIGIALTSLSMAGGLSWFIGTLAFAPKAVAGELETLKAIVRMQVEMQAERADEQSRSIDRLTDNVNKLIKKMGAREAVEADREKRLRRPARYPRERFEGSFD